MALTGTSPTYFNYDNFDAIHVTTAGQPITQRTGGTGLNFVVKRGTNMVHGGARGYFDNQATEWSNVPAELAANGVTPETADHTKQITDFGADLGGLLLRDKMWFYASYSVQDVKLQRRNIVDRTELKNPNAKVNWQATPKDMVSFLYFNGFKSRTTAAPAPPASSDAPTATFHQDNAYTDNRCTGCSLGRPRDLVEHVPVGEICVLTTPASC
jgi:hypothetical protein